MTRNAIHPPTGCLVTPEEFIRREGPQWRDKVHPRCPACGADLAIHGVHSTNVTARFRHHPGADCPLSSTPNPRYAHLVPEAWDPEGGARLKAVFCEDENLKQAYWVCRWLCGNHLPSREFIQLCRRADRLGVFRYRGLPLWVIPWLLVTLADFTRTKRSAQGGDVSRDGLEKKQYQFRFILKKPAQTSIDAMWIDPSKCMLEKVFVNSGRRMQNGLIPLRKEIREMDKEATAWIGGALLNRLRECCAKPGHYE